MNAQALHHSENWDSRQEIICFDQIYYTPALAGVLGLAKFDVNHEFVPHLVGGAAWKIA